MFKEQRSTQSYDSGRKLRILMYVTFYKGIFMWVKIAAILPRPFLRRCSANLTNNAYFGIDSWELTSCVGDDSVKMSHRNLYGFSRGGWEPKSLGISSQIPLKSKPLTIYSRSEWIVNQTSWGYGGRCKPPIGVQGRSPWKILLSTRNSTPDFL